MNYSKTFHFLNGHFEWDFFTNGIEFISHKAVSPDLKKKKTHLNVITPGHYDIGFNDEFDLIEKRKFRKLYQRKCKFHETPYVLMQDVKDVALYMANPQHLTFQFIDFFHIPMVDQYLRALILYFQFYFQIYNEMIAKRKETDRKIRQPLVTILENVVRDDLSDLRCMISREYCSILIGAKGSKRFHHMANKNQVSLSEKDRRLYEMLIKMSTRVVWVALHRPNLAIIEFEMERLTRSDYFNKFAHINQEKLFHITEHEKRILHGAHDIEQCRLVSQSPLGKECIIADHDHRLLAIGQVDFPPSDERLRFLEAVYLLPEEELFAQDICIGILGKLRSQFDSVLKFKRKKKEDDEISKDELLFEFHMPPRIYHSGDTVPTSYPENPPRFKYVDRQKIIKAQCRLWKMRTNQSHQDEEMRTPSFTIYSSMSTIAST